MEANTMSLEYCEDCNKNIDLDTDSEHEHFLKDLEAQAELGIE